VSEYWSSPVGAYPHSGEFIMPNWQFIEKCYSGLHCY
jgi:hypothetical protein